MSKSCSECGNKEFRYLYPSGGKSPASDPEWEGDIDLVICTECGADAPDCDVEEIQPQIVNL